MKTGIVYSEKYLEHDLGPGHPEKPERLRSIMDSIRGEKSLFEKLQIIEPEPANIKDIELAHDHSYVEKIKELSKTGRRLTLDTPISEETFGLALLAAGGTIGLTQMIADAELENGFALVRPPGHHATRNSGGGFCYFNNISIAAKKLLKRDDIERILIFDFDSHHGNGTQDIFYEENKVLYISFHQSGRTLYPGTGFSNEIGGEEGKGYTINIPFPPGSTDENYAAALREFFIPLANQFSPDIILSSAGLDPHSEDPLTQLQLSTQGFEWLAQAAIDRANGLCGGKIAFVLEGGYAIDAATRSVMKIINALVNQEAPDLPAGGEIKEFDKFRKNFSPYWNI